MTIRPKSEFATTLSACCDGRLDSLAVRLRSLLDGDAAVLDAVQIGSEAISMLRELLFERDRAGVFEPRTRAVQALGALHAYHVLREFLAVWEPPSDPVEKLGDEAVLGMAANALASVGDEESFAILLGMARDHPMRGVIEALGTYRRVEPIPLLIEALLDDCAAEPAKHSLRVLGPRVVPALINTALQPISGASGRETPSSIRRRRHALSLLIDLNATREEQDRIRSLVHDLDDEIAALACRIGITSSDRARTQECAIRLLQLLLRATWPLRREIEDCLIAHATLTRELIENTLCMAEKSPPADLPAMRFVRSLRRILTAAPIAHGSGS